MTREEMDAEISADIVAQSIKVEQLDLALSIAFDNDPTLGPTYMALLADWAQARKVLRAMMGEPEPVYPPMTAAELTLLRAEHCPF